MKTVGRLILKMQDHDNDIKQLSFPTNDSLGASFAAGDALAAALSAAIDGIVIGNIIYNGYLYDENVVVNPVPPANGFAQNHTQWLLHLKDTQDAHMETLSIPTADLGTAGLRYPNSDQADLSHASWVAVKDAIEDFYISNSGNPVTLESAEIKE